MKFLTHHSAGTAGGRWSDVVLVGLAACLIAAAPALASGGGRPPDPNNTVSGGDETIGSLPVVGGGTIRLPMTRNWRGTRPAFYLEGAPGDLSLAVLAASGQGFVSVEVVDPAAQRLRLAFHGDVTLLLDRDLVSALPIEVGLAVPGSFGSGRATITFGQEPQRVVCLRPGLLHLPVSSMSAQSALDTSSLRVLVTDSSARHSAHTIAACADVLIFRQVD